MSVELQEEAGGKILMVKLSGKLTKQDYEHFVPEVGRLIARARQDPHPGHMHDFHGWTMGALAEDFMFDLKHFAQIERLALVGDRKWEADMAMFCKAFTNATIRYFDEARFDEAISWIHEGVAQPA